MQTYIKTAQYNMDYTVSDYLLWLKIILKTKLNNHRKCKKAW